MTHIASVQQTILDRISETPKTRIEEHAAAIQSIAAAAPGALADKSGGDAKPGTAIPGILPENGDPF